MWDYKKLGVLPSELRETVVKGSEAYMRAKALGAMLLMFTAVTFINTAVYTWAHFYTEFPVVISMYTGWGALFLMSLQTYLYYKFANYKISGTFLSIQYFVTVVILVFISGGYDSAFKLLLVTCPLIGFLLGGRQEGIQNCVFVVFIGMALILASAFEVEFLNFLADQEEHIYASISWVVTMLVILTCLLSYEDFMRDSQPL